MGEQFEVEKLMETWGATPGATHNSFTTPSQTTSRSCKNPYPSSAPPTCSTLQTLGSRTGGDAFACPCRSRASSTHYIVDELRCWRHAGVVDIRQRVGICTECKVEIEVCPRCSIAHLQHRRGKHGAFLGCSSHPACSYTRATTAR